MSAFPPPCSPRTIQAWASENGVNAFGVKNLIGSFAPPFAVLNDFDFLRTLHPRDKIAGMAEAVKVALSSRRRFLRMAGGEGRCAAGLRTRTPWPA